MSDAAAMYSGKSDGYFAGARTDVTDLLPGKMESVLELGCGTGATMRWLRATYDIRYAHGIELMPAVAEQARTTFDQVDCGSVETMELPEGPFDLILALDVLEHLVDPWTVLRRLRERMRPGGCIVISLPNISHVSVTWPLLTRADWTYGNSGILDRTHLRFFTETSAVELVTGAGCSVDKIAWNKQPPACLNWMSPALRWHTMRLLWRVLPRHLLAIQFLIRAKG